MIIEWADRHTTAINIDHGFGFIKLYERGCEEEIGELSNMESYEFGNDIKAIKEKLIRIHDSKTTTVCQNKVSLKALVFIS